MKKIAVIAIVLIGAIFSANTALAKYVGSSDGIITAKSGSVDVKIVERTMDDGCSKDYSSEVIDAVSSIEETLSNLTPGDEVTLSYKIINKGCIDVLLDGVNVTVDNQELSNYITLKWTLTQYENGNPVNSVSNGTNGLKLKSASGSTKVSFADVKLDCDCKDSDYCILELTINLENDSQILSKTVKETVFTITPSFTQY